MHFISSLISSIMYGFYFFIESIKFISLNICELFFFFHYKYFKPFSQTLQITHFFPVS